MPGTSGLRRKTRHQFSRGFGQHGYIPLSVYLRPFKVGDYVDIKVNAAIHKVCRLGKMFLGARDQSCSCGPDIDLMRLSFKAPNVLCAHRVCPTSGTTERLASSGT